MVEVVVDTHMENIIMEKMVVQVEQVQDKQMV